MVLPYFDYGDVLYQNSSTKLINKLQSLQNRGLRLCFGNGTLLNTDEMHIEAHVCKLEQRRLQHVYTFMILSRKTITYLWTTGTLKQEPMMQYCALLNNPYVRNTNIIYFTMVHDCGMIYLCKRGKLLSIQSSKMYKNKRHNTNIIMRCKISCIPLTFIDSFYLTVRNKE